MKDERIAVGLEGPIGRVAIRRPEKKNALDTPMAAALEAGLADLQAEPACKVVVISGEGGTLSAGADLSERRAEVSGEDGRQYSHSSMFRALSESRLPTVALVDGWAIGIGLGIVGAATFAVGGQSARFMLPEAKLGYVPFAVVPYLAGRVAPEIVMLWSLSGAEVGVQEAAERGLLTHWSTSADAAEVAAPVIDALVGVPRQIGEDGVAFIRQARRPALAPLVEWCEEEMAAVVQRMREGDGEPPAPKEARR